MAFFIDVLCGAQIAPQSVEAAPKSTLRKQKQDENLWKTTYMKLQVFIFAAILISTVASFAILMPSLSDTQAVPEAEGLRRGMHTWPLPASQPPW